jgi:MFS family permease
MAAAIRSYGHRVWGFGRNVKLYLACTILRSTTFALSSLLFNLYLSSLGFDAAFIGLNNTLFSIASLVCSLPAGLIADRIGRKRAMIIGMVGATLSRVGVSVFSEGWLIACSSMLLGIVGPLFYTSIAPFLTENSTDKERSILFTLDSSLMNLTSFFVMTGGGYLPRLFASLLNVGPESVLAYRGAMVASACTMALALVPILWLSDPPRPTRARAASRLWRRFSNPRLLGKLLIPRVFVAFGAGLIFPFLNLFFKERFGVSDATLGWIFGVTSALSAVTMLVGGALADRLGKIQAMLLARTISTPLLLIIGFVPSLPIAVAAHWIRSGFMRLGQPLYLAFAMEQLAEEERATGSSLIMMSWDVGWSAGPYVSGLVQVRSGFGPLFAATVLFYTLGLISVYAFFVRKGKAAHQG